MRHRLDWKLPFFQMFLQLLRLCCPRCEKNCILVMTDEWWYWHIEKYISTIEYWTKHLTLPCSIFTIRGYTMTLSIWILDTLQTLEFLTTRVLWPWSYQISPPPPVHWLTTPQRRGRNPSQTQKRHLGLGFYFIQVLRNLWIGERDIFHLRLIIIVNIALTPVVQQD